MNPQYFSGVELRARRDWLLLISAPHRWQWIYDHESYLCNRTSLSHAVASYYITLRPCLWETYSNGRVLSWLQSSFFIFYFTVIHFRERWRTEPYIALHYVFVFPSFVSPVNL